MVKLGFVSFDISPFLGLQCTLGKFDYVDKLYSSTLVPLFVVTLIGCFYMREVVGSILSNDDPEFMKRANSYEVPEELQKKIDERDLKQFLMVFAAVDIDGSGVIDRAEFTAAAKKYNANIEDGKIKVMARALGFKGGQEVGVAEFLTMVHKARAEGKGNGFLGMAEKVQGQVTRIAGQTQINLLLLWTFLILIGTSTIVLFFFKCDELNIPEIEGGGTVSFMFKDYSVDCNGERYQATVPFCSLMVLIYPVGIPAMYTTMLFSKRHILSSWDEIKREEAMGNPTIGHVTFLVKSYEPKYYYFEALDCFRRLLLATVIGLVSYDSAAGPVLGVAFALGFTYVFNLRPFQDPQGDILGILLSHSLVLLFLGATMIKVGTAAVDQRTFSYALFCVMCAGPFAAFLMVGSIVKHIMIAPEIPAAVDPENEVDSYTDDVEEIDEVAIVSRTNSRAAVASAKQAAAASSKNGRFGAGLSSPGLLRVKNGYTVDVFVESAGCKVPMVIKYLDKRNGIAELAPGTGSPADVPRIMFVTITQCEEALQDAMMATMRSVLEKRQMAAAASSRPERASKAFSPELLPSASPELAVLAPQVDEGLNEVLKAAGISKFALPHGDAGAATLPAVSAMDDSTLMRDLKMSKQDVRRLRAHLKQQEDNRYDDTKLSSEVGELGTVL